MYPTTRILCPIDGCDWVCDATPPEVPALALASVFGEGVMTAASHTQHTHRVERDLRAHLESHKVDDFVSTITKLKQQYAELLHVIQELSS